MSKKKKLSNEEKLSSVIGDISAITNKNRGKKSRPGNSSRDIVLQRNETGVRVYPNRRRRGSSQSLIKAKVSANEEDIFMDDEGASVTGSPPTFADKITIEEDLANVIEDCQSIVEELDTGPTQWQKRVEHLEENWETIREPIFTSALSSHAPPSSPVLCLKCNVNEAVLKCRQCGVLQCLCAQCDDDTHRSQPLHDREVWLNGYFQPISPTQSVSSNQLVSVERSCPLVYPLSCPVCNTSTIKRTNSSTVLLVTCQGRYDLNWFSVGCPSCLWHWAPISVECIVESGFWPGSPSNVNYLFDQKLFSLWDAFRKRMPGSSQTAFLRSLEDLSFEKGRINVINPVTFRKAFSEWCYCQHEINILCGQDWTKCPPCTIDQHSCDVDGNQKVYRFSKVPRGPSHSYYCNKLIAENSQVDEHIRDLGPSQSGNSTQKEDSSCGDTHWKAAKAVSKSKKHQDETGLEVAGCRHSIAQAALNMFRGEIYGYAHYLHMNFLYPNNVKFMWEDVICKYWPWAQRISSSSCSAALSSVTPALSIMHGKSHSWSCQVIWSGRWQEGAAATAGEEVEQINSYLSRLGSTTKNMTASGREESITEHLLSWNRRKIISQPMLLLTRLRKTETKLAEAKKDLTNMTSELDMADTELDDSIVQWKEEVQQFAREQQTGLLASPTAFEEFFLLHHKVKNAEHLKIFVNANDDPTQTLVGEKEVLRMAHNKTKELEKNKAKLEKLKNKLMHQDNLTEQQILLQGKNQLARVTIMKLQKQLEMLYFSIAKRTKEISSLADSSKRRSSMRAKCSKEKAEIISVVEELNSVASLCGLPPTNTEDVMSGIFSWSFNESDTALPAVPIRNKAQLVEKFMLVKRLEEEETLLKMEMKNFLRFYLDRILPSLGEEKDKIKERIDYVNDVDEPDDKYSQEKTNLVDKNDNRYCIRHNTIQSLRGRLAIAKKGIAFAKSQIRNGCSLFVDLEQSLSNIEDSDDEFLSDSDNDSDDAYAEEDLEYSFNDEN